MRRAYDTATVTMSKAAWLLINAGIPVGPVGPGSPASVDRSAVGDESVDVVYLVTAADAGGPVADDAVAVHESGATAEPIDLAGEDLESIRAAALDEAYRIAGVRVFEPAIVDSVGYDVSPAAQTSWVALLQDAAAADLLGQASWPAGGHYFVANDGTLVLLATRLQAVALYRQLFAAGLARQQAIAGAAYAIRSATTTAAVVAALLAYRA